MEELIGMNMEALIFGHIVITLHSPLDDLYKDLPVIIVKDW